VGCSRVRRELLEQFRFPEELGARSGPHLAHLETCAACREEVGIDRELVQRLRLALRERVENDTPSAASWDLVRQRTVDRPAKPWTARVLQWGALLPAAVAAILMFAVATGPQSPFLSQTQSPAPVVEAALAQRAAPPAKRASREDPPSWVKSQSPQLRQQRRGASWIPPIPGGFN
jgi:anti-sigma factor RsiW